MQAYIVVHNLYEKKFGCHSGSVLQWYIHLYWLIVLRKDEQRILYSGSGDVPSAEIVPFSGDPGPHLLHGSWSHRSSYPNRHRDRSIRFCTAHGCDQQTDRHTYRPPNDNNTPHLMLALRGGLIMTEIYKSVLTENSVATQKHKSASINTNKIQYKIQRSSPSQ